jgi:peptidoglycan-N-acetylglucosamine deacetylase
MEIASSLIAGAGLTGCAAYLSPMFWRQYSVGHIRKVLRRDHILSLTYDDGPSSSVTPQILGLLRRRKAHATFFILGAQAQRYSRIADQIVREGHQVGCHSYHHLNALKSAPWSAIQDIQLGYRHLSRWMPPDAMFRPPYGKMTLPSWWSIRRRKASVWWWTIDSGDSSEQIPSVAEVVEQVRRDCGGIVLMHDLDRDKKRNEFVLELTDALLDLATKQSLKLARIRELVNR